MEDDALVELLVAEIHQVDGVDIESIRPASDALHDPRVDALETAARLAGASDVDSALRELCELGVRTVGAEWGVVTALAQSKCGESSQLRARSTARSH